MKVQELLSSEDKWTQGCYAKDKDGHYVWYDSLDAVRWCLLGAVRKCYPLKEDKIIYKIHGISNTSIGDFNDSHSYEEVMDIVRRLDI